MADTNETTRGTVGNPVCAFHGKTAAEHEFGRCLYCCLCFTTLTPNDCWKDENGVRWDMCKECGDLEAARSAPGIIRGKDGSVIGAKSISDRKFLAPLLGPDGGESARA